MQVFPSFTWASTWGLWQVRSSCRYQNGENINWHLGFSAAGIGMVLGLIQYVWGGRYLGEAGHLKLEGQAADRSSPGLADVPSLVSVGSSRWWSSFGGSKRTVC